jgi:hypothetical protein
MSVADDRLFLVVSHAWTEALRAAYSTARGIRLAELHGRRPKLRDDRGVDVYSHECGRVAALEGLAPALALCGFDPVAMRRAAESDAYDEFVAWLMEHRT